MSIKLMTLAFEADLPSTQKFVLVALSDCCNDDGMCFPSMEKIAKKCGIDPRSARRCIAELEAMGIVRREFRDQRSTIYWVDLNPETPDPKSGTPGPKVRYPRTQSPVPPDPKSAITVIEPSVNRHLPDDDAASPENPEALDETQDLILTNLNGDEFARAVVKAYAEAGNPEPALSMNLGLRIKLLAEQGGTAMRKLAWWAWFFDELNDDPWWQEKRQASRRDWRPTLGWLLEDKNFSQKVEQIRGRAA